MRIEEERGPHSILNYTVLIRTDDSWPWMEYRPGRRYFFKEAVRTAREIEETTGHRLEAIAAPNGPEGGVV